MSPRQPSGVALTWGLRPTRRRGPAASLDIADIATAGVALADRDGLAAVTMQAVAGCLGCTKMALYRYVNSKDDLVALMFDAAVGEPPPAVAEAPSWRSGLHTWASDLLRVHLVHPWVADVPIGSSTLTRNQARWLEAALTTLAGTPLPTEDKLDLVLLLNAHVLFSAKVILDGTAHTPSPDAAAIAAAMSPADLPHVTAALRSGRLGDGKPMAGFSRGLGYVLAGIEARTRPD